MDARGIISRSCVALLPCAQAGNAGTGGGPDTNIVTLCAGKLLYKGAFQVGDPSGRWSSPFNLAIRQPANTGVLDWAGSILALFERDLPYKLTPELHTEGPSTLQVFKDDDMVLAHYRIVQTEGGERRLVTMAPGMAGLDADCKFIEIDEAGQKVWLLSASLPFSLRCLLLIVFFCLLLWHNRTQNIRVCT